MSILFSSFDKGKLKLKNRLVMPPMATSKSLPDGSVSKELLDYYDEKTQGGYIGLVITEHSFICAQGKASAGQMSVAEDRMIDGMRQLADVIHKNGSKAAVQINHAGSATSASVTGMPTVAPSAVNLRRDELPEELTEAGIREVIGFFASAAERVKEAGFDAVEIHAAHGYLLSQFYSPLTNKRQDDYGKDLTGRIRMHTDVIKQVRLAVGPDFPIIMRLGASDYREGGATIEDSLAAAPKLVKTGLDMLDISGGFCGYTVPGLTRQGFFSGMTESLKKVVSIPVMLTGGITDPSAAEEILAAHKTDLTGVGRPIYKDSKWPEKAFQILTQGSQKTY